MELKLKLNDLKKRFFNKAFDNLQKRIEVVDSEYTTDTTINKITKDLVKELNQIKAQKRRKLGPKQVKALKEFEAQILAGGGFQNINPQILAEYLKAINWLKMSQDRRFSIRVNAQDFFSMHDAIIDIELNKYKKQLAIDGQESNQDRKDILFELLREGFANKESEEDQIKHYEDIDELLKQYFDIDITTGKNVGQIPSSVFENAIHCLERVYSTTGYEEDFDYIGVIKRFASIYLTERVKENIEHPEMIIIKEPAIMLLYNMLNYEYTDSNGNVFPKAEFKKIIGELLSILPSNIPVSNEEKDFLDECSTKYKTECMPKDIYIRYLDIYLKMLLNKITDRDLKSVQLMKYSSTLLAQDALENPVLSEKNPEYVHIDRYSRVSVLTQDYAKDLQELIIPGKKYKMLVFPRGVEDSKLGYQTGVIRKVSIDTNSSIGNIINAIYHELEHALVEEDFNNSIYKNPIQYVANKSLFIRSKVDYIYASGIFNYWNDPGEIDARLAGDIGSHRFVSEHITDEKKAKKVLKESNLSERKNKRLIKSFSKLKHPKIIKRKAQTYTMWIDTIKYFRDLRIFDPDYEEKIFDRDLYRQKVRIGPTRNAEEDSGGYKVPYSLARRIDINKLFDKVIKRELELCQPGKYYSIEYDPEGNRKPLKQILAEMNTLDESEENDGKRSVYQYIIGEVIIGTESPTQIFDALFNYQGTNDKNSKVVEQVVQNKLGNLLLLMEKEAGKDEVSRLVGKFKKTSKTQSNNLSGQAAETSSETTITVDDIAKLTSGIDKGQESETIIEQ